MSRRHIDMHKACACNPPGKIWTETETDHRNCRMSRCRLGICNDTSGPQGEVSGDRIVRFITSFVASRDPAREEECDTFAEKLLRLLISLVTARDKSVRARCCQFVQVIFNSLKADELDEELLDSMQDTMLLRLGDKVPAVRVQAVQALPRLCEPGDVSPQVFRMHLTSNLSRLRTSCFCWSSVVHSI